MSAKMQKYPVLSRNIPKSLYSRSQRVLGRVYSRHNTMRPTLTQRFFFPNGKQGVEPRTAEAIKVLGNHTPTSGMYDDDDVDVKCKCKVTNRSDKSDYG